MNKSKWIGIALVLVIISVFSIASVSAQESDAVITLERQPCFGSCPVYTVAIHEDGTVIYNGAQFVTVEGEQTGQIPPETVALMVEELANAGYFDWNEAYDTMLVTDLPTIITSVTRDGETHRITRYAGDDSAPLALPFLESWIDAMAGTAAWTGVQPDVTTNFYSMNSPLATLERTPCFGFCPTYSVVLFADGTVVYTGIANVNEIGVRVLQADPLEVTSVAQRAESLGYFGWQDSYDTQAITDQVTVITSLNWNDHYKRIVRYDGDPNAPVGLVWVEDMIDQVLENLGFVISD